MKNHCMTAADVASLITERMMCRGRVPAVSVFRSEYGMSKATAYRWHAWASDRMRSLALFHNEEPIENPMPAEPTKAMKTYEFTHNGETRTLNAAAIRRWTGLTMVRETLQVNLDWLTENIGNPQYKLLAFTTHGVMMAAHYRNLDGQRRSLAGARKRVFNQPTGGARV